MERHANPRAQMFRGATAWESVSAQEMLRRVAGLANALMEMGIRAGDRVAIFAPNCPEWHIADFAIQGLGGVTVPVYFNESEERLIYILNDAGARVVFTKGEAQAQKIAGCRRRVPSLEKVITAGPSGVGDFLGYITLIHAAGESAIAEYKQRAAEIRADRLATIIYTSGTTGEPKGVMLSHANMTSNAVDSLASYEFRPDDIALSFLPLAHVYERTMDYGYMFRGVSVAYLEKMETVAEALLEVHPTITAAVPRFFEKIYANIVEKGHHESGLKRRIFDWALQRGSRSGSVARVWQRRSRLIAAEMAHCGRDCLFEDSRRSWRAHPFVLFGRSAVGAGAGRIFLVGEAAGLPGIWVDRNVTNRRGEPAGGKQSGNGRSADPACGSENRRGRRSAGEGCVRHAGLLQQGRGDARGVHAGRMVLHRRYRQGRCAMVMCPSRTARRNCSKPRGANSWLPRPIENLLKTSHVHLQRDGRGREAQIRFGIAGAGFRGHRVGGAQGGTGIFVANANGQ